MASDWNKFRFHSLVTDSSSLQNQAIGDMIKIQIFLYKEGDILIPCIVTFKLMENLENLLSMVTLKKILHLICLQKCYIL